MARQFRKLPVVIAAVQSDGTAKRVFEIIEWSRGKAVEYLPDGEDTMDDEIWLQIHTLEGTHIAKPGDWIIRGVANEHYPCDDAIFRATYEPVDGEPF